MSRTQPSTLISLNKSNHTKKRTKIKRIVPAPGGGGEESKAESRKKKKEEGDKVGV